MLHKHSAVKMPETANNIVQFPKKFKQPLMGDLPTTIQQVNKNIENVVQYHIEETIDTIIPNLFDQLIIAGAMTPEEEDNCDKDRIMIIEAIRSLMCKRHGLSHPIQLLADNLFEEIDGVFDVSKNVKIIITPIDKTT